MRVTASCVVTLLLAALLAGCTNLPSQPYATAAGNTPNYQYAVFSNSTVNQTLDGTSYVGNLTNSFSNWLNIGGASEVSIWQNCTAPVNYTTIRYQYTMDLLLLQNGSITLPGCGANTSKTDITDKNMGYLRFSLVGVNGTPLVQNGTSIMVGTR